MLCVGAQNVTKKVTTVTDHADQFANSTKSFTFPGKCSSNRRDTGHQQMTSYTTVDADCLFCTPIHTLFNV